MINLRRMSQSEYDDYYRASTQILAEELAKAHGLAFQDASLRARKSFDSLLPEGFPNAIDQYLYTILKGEQKIGALWFGIKRDRSDPEAYVWDVTIEPTYRGRGYGKNVMLLLEDEVRGMGLSRISLNVFEHNTRASQLYEKLNYRTISRIMSKEI